MSTSNRKVPLSNTKCQFHQDYVGRDFRWSVPITQVWQPVGLLTNQQILNVQNAFDVYRLMSLATHEDVSCLTLRPIEYRPHGEGSLVTFGGLVAERPSFLSRPFPSLLLFRLYYVCMNA